MVWTVYSGTTREATLVFEGIHTVLYAFFGPDGALDRAAMRRQAEACVAGGCHGVVVLGLATEVSKLSAAERQAVVGWAVDDIGGRVPLGATIFGRSPAEQIEAVRQAETAGAAWVILQPPPEPGMPEAALMRFFGPVIERARIPVALQNAPEFMGLGLSTENLSRMCRDHANLAALKAEGPSTLVQRVVDATDGRVAVLNGRGGLELPDNLRAGASGIVPAPDCFDGLAEVYARMKAGDGAGADRLYAALLPAVVFAMQGVDHLVCYGKRIVAERLGLGPVHDRAPCLAPTAFGMGVASRYAAALGPYRGVTPPGTPAAPR